MQIDLRFMFTRFLQYESFKYAYELYRRIFCSLQRIHETLSLPVFDHVLLDQRYLARMLFEWLPCLRCCHRVGAKEMLRMVV
jgi:hypothetical protein